MSEENVEIVRQVSEAFQRGLEHDDPEAIFDTGLLAHDWEWMTSVPFEGKSVWRGRQEYAEFLRRWMGEFEDYSVEFEELIDAGDDQVVIIYRQRATGRGSGVPVEWELGAVTELRAGHVIGSTNYFAPAEALEAAGLSDSAFGREAAVDNETPARPVGEQAPGRRRPAD
jgi:ketosteroid isomerase-like protein